MFNINASDIVMWLLSLPIVLLALSVHEASHGFMAYKLGDQTARNFGRLTLNPIKHIDPIGFVCMVLFHFGWAKPVPVNSRYLKKPRRDMALTAAAGPISNVLLSLIFAAILRFEIFLFKEYFLSGILEPTLGFKIFTIVTYMTFIGVLLNISLAIFNLIPIPPFDGSRIAYTFLPVNLYFKVMKYERFIMLGILALMFFTPVFDVAVSPVINWLTESVMSIFGFSKFDNYLSLEIILNYVEASLIS